MEKRCQENASTKLNIRIGLEFGEVGSFDLSDLDSLDAEDRAEPYSIEDPDLIFPSTSSGSTGSTRLYSKSPISLIAFKLHRNLLTSKIISNREVRLNLSAGQWTALMGAIFTEGGIPV